MGGSDALHVTNGDATVPGLRGAGLKGTIMPWRDILHEGPVPDVPDDELRRIRAAFLERWSAEDIGTEAELAARDATLERHRGGAYVLWFEADLYDQLQLIQILARLRALEVPPSRITLICIGEHLGIAHFGGLGELTAGQLGRLPATRLDGHDPGGAGARVRRVGRAARARPGRAGPARRLALARAAVPRRGDRPALREYPSTRDGLSLTERRILAAVGGGRADGRRRVRPRRRARGAAVPRRHVVLRPDDEPRPGGDAAARRRVGRRSPHAAAPHRGRPARCWTDGRTTCRSTASTAGWAACT